MGKTLSDQMGEILTLEEVAAHLNAGKRAAYRLASSRKISAFKLVGTRRLCRTELNQWIASHICRATPSAGTGAAE